MAVRAWLFYDMVKYFVPLHADLIFALEGQPDLIFYTAIQPTFPATKQTEMTYGRPYYKRAMVNGLVGLCFLS